jgi:hypothetical protein
MSWVTHLEVGRYEADGVLTRHGVSPDFTLDEVRRGLAGHSEINARACDLVRWNWLPFLTNFGPLLA